MSRSPAGRLADKLRETSYSVFYDRHYPDQVRAQDGRSLFEAVFRQSRIVVVFLSESYTKKPWTRLEWEVIRERLDTTFVVRLDDADLPGLPETWLYHPLAEVGDWAHLLRACLKRIDRIKRDDGSRTTQFERTLADIREESTGATAMALSAVVNNRRRSKPLEDAEMPADASSAANFEEIERAWYIHATARRLSVKILVPPNLDGLTLRATIQKCAIAIFNQEKPDAMLVYALEEVGALPKIHMTFAPFGRWDRALDGVMYDIPTSEFRFSFD